MKLIVQLRLFPDPQQRDALKHTLHTANAACNHLSQVAWTQQVFRRFDLQKVAYHAVREQFGLSAQMTIRCLAKVGDAYKVDWKRPRTFKPLGAIAYDDRILSWEYDNQTVSIWTVQGRQRMSDLRARLQARGAHSRRNAVCASSRVASDAIRKTSTTRSASDLSLKPNAHSVPSRWKT